MEQPFLLKRLVDRLVHIEQELTTVRHELAKLDRGEPLPSQATAGQPAFDYNWADKKALIEEMNRLFALLSIEGKPEGVLSLQEEMGRIGLAPDELSRDLVAARED